MKTLDEAMLAAAAALVDQIRQRTREERLLAALASLAADGWVLVPREATAEVKIAAGDIGGGFGLTENQVIAAWLAKLAAAPKLGGSDDGR